MSALLSGTHRWLGLDLLVSTGVLAPRQETELLGRTVIGRLRADQQTAGRVIDMCCGAGNLACGIAHTLPGVRVLACDLTDSCVGLAERNVTRLGLSNRVTVQRGDLFEAVVGSGFEDGVDLIVCNPPYISTGRLAQDRAELLDHEPREAFDGGPYGLTIQQRVIREGAAYVAPGGTLAFEFGEGQDRQIAALFSRARNLWDQVELVADERGRNRVAMARRTAEPA